MHEFGRLEAVVGGLAPQVPPREAAQLVVDDGHQAVHGVRVAAVDGGQLARDEGRVGGAGHERASSASASSGAPNSSA